MLDKNKNGNDMIETGRALFAHHPAPRRDEEILQIRQQRIEEESLGDLESVQLLVSQLRRLKGFRWKRQLGRFPGKGFS